VREDDYEFADIAGRARGGLVIADTHRSGAFEVVIAGGGVAAIETASALSKLAGGLVSLTLLTPNQEFFYRPMTIHEPFGGAPAKRYPLARIAETLDAELVEDRFAWVGRTTRTAHLASGGQLHYDALVLCLGAVARTRYEHAVTIEGRHGDELRDLVGRIDGGQVSRLALVVPERLVWPLPLYEVALMSAARAAAKDIELAITFLTSERAPLEIFGESASRGVSKLLGERRIDLITSLRCEIPSAGQILISPDRRAGDPRRTSVDPEPRRLSADQVVSLPELYGPHVRGLPGADNGFIPVDLHCRVRGVERVYAAGDATDFAVKHGGIAAQQADAAAESIAALAGAPVKPQPFRPAIQGMLLTGAAPYYLSAWIIGGHASGSQLTSEATWAPASKIAAKHLVAYLEQIGR
jgi:sulfide:quinone oxidoreductase